MIIYKQSLGYTLTCHSIINTKPLLLLVVLCLTDAKHRLSKLVLCNHDCTYERLVTSELCLDDRRKQFPAKVTLPICNTTLCTSEGRPSLLVTWLTIVPPCVPLITLRCKESISLHTLEPNNIVTGTGYIVTVVVFYVINCAIFSESGCLDGDCWWH